MNWFDRIKGFYKGGRWSKAMVWDTVGARRITPDQYLEITGDTYDANNRPVDSE